MSTSSESSLSHQQFDLRCAEATDEQALATIRRDAILALAVTALSSAEAEAWARQVTADRFRRAIHEHEVWVAVADSVIGWVEIESNTIAALYVAPLHAQQGVGSALLAHAEVAIWRAGYQTVQLDASSNALAFYLRRAYCRAGPPTADGAYPLCKELAIDQVYHDPTVASLSKRAPKAADVTAVLHAGVAAPCVVAD